MSSLRALDLNVVADLVSFIRGPGYVLEFSDSSFREFFATQLDVDIDVPCYSENGGSKGKRLRSFLQLVDDVSAKRCLVGLWEHRRDYLLRSGATDPVPNAEARYLAVLARLAGSSGNEGAQETPRVAFNLAKAADFEIQLLDLSRQAPQRRGFAFETYLNALFRAYGLSPQGPFRNRGEQIDGSFVHSDSTYLLEAKWQAAPTGVGDLHTFEGKLLQKAAWARGLFLSYSGFTEEGLEAFGRAKRTICMDGADLADMLKRQLPLDEVISRKARRAAETGRPFIPVREIFGP